MSHLRVGKLNYIDVQFNTFFKEHLPEDGHNRWLIHVGSYAAYSTINLHLYIYIYAFLGHIAYNESSVHGHESFEVRSALYYDAHRISVYKDRLDSRMIVD